MSSLFGLGKCSVYRIHTQGSDFILDSKDTMGKLLPDANSFYSEC